MKVTKKDAQTVWSNLQHLIESLSLIAVSAYTFYGVFHYHVATYPRYALMFAASVIALRGASEFIKHLAQKNDA